MARGAGAERVVRGDPARQPLAIDAFASEVRRVLINSAASQSRGANAVERGR
jgi:hypothetical protein